MIARQSSRRQPKVRVVDDALLAGVDERIDVRIQRAEVRRVEMYKRDEITTDLICCEIVFGQGGDVRAVTFHEELGGWDDLLRWIEALPGFKVDWRSAVVQPPFAENRTTVFETP